MKEREPHSLTLPLAACPTGERSHDSHMMSCDTCTNTLEWSSSTFPLSFPSSALTSVVWCLVSDSNVALAASCQIMNIHEALSLSCDTHLSRLLLWLGRGWWWWSLLVHVWHVLVGTIGSIWSTTHPPHWGLTCELHGRSSHKTERERERER